MRRRPAFGRPGAQASGKSGVFRGAHEAGRVGVRAIAPPKRDPGLPDIPTVRETGPAMVARMTSMGSGTAFTPGAALDAHRRDQRAFWTRLVREANIQAEQGGHGPCC